MGDKRYRHQYFRRTHFGEPREFEENRKQNRHDGSVVDEGRGHCGKNHDRNKRGPKATPAQDGESHDDEVQRACAKQAGAQNEHSSHGHCSGVTEPGNPFFRSHDSGEQNSSHRHERHQIDSKSFGNEERNSGCDDEEDKPDLPVHRTSIRPTSFFIGNRLKRSCILGRQVNEGG